jgi:hypothetical protein
MNKQKSISQSVIFLVAGSGQQKHRKSLTAVEMAQLAYSVGGNKPLVLGFVGL